jgi:peptidoglycan/LPS O-acetylase OafA/YrhL
MDDKEGLAATAGLGSRACAILIFVGWPITVLFPLWLFGALISALPKRLSLKQAKQLSWIFGIVLLIDMFGVRLLPLRAIQAEYIVGFLTSLLLWAVVQQTAPAKGGLYKTISGFFSRISNTLYLFHLPMAMFLYGFLNSPWHPWAYTQRNVAMYLVSDAMIVVLVYGIWRVFEENTDLIREKVFERERRMS